MASGTPSSLRIGIGCAKVGEATNGVSWRQAVRMLRRAADGGVTYFDTADAYTNGTSERLIGDAFRRSRDDVTIATKAGFVFAERSRTEARLRFLLGPAVRRLGHRAVAPLTSEAGKYSNQDFNPARIRDAVEASLRRLDTDYIDVFQLHAPDSADCDIEGMQELAHDLVTSGKVNRFGVAVEGTAAAETWLQVDVVRSIQLPFGPLDSTAEQLIARAADRDVSIVVRGLLGGGLLARDEPDADIGDGPRRLREIAARRSMTPTELAIAFASGHPGVDVALIGVRRAHHVDDLLEARRWPTPPAGLLEEITAPRS